jgi:divalent metal cation (Fe/Co/Zn/Cd) transporter
VTATVAHRHGRFTHVHRVEAPHRHPWLPFRSEPLATAPAAAPAHPHPHSHGLVDPSIVRSRAGVRVVARSLVVLAVTALLQAVVFMASGSVALLADLVHNGGDALTAVPLAIAFLARSARAERAAGYFVIATIFASAVFAGIESVERLLHPQHLDHLAALALAGVIGFAGNELAARIRLRGGRRLDSAALVADGHHARVDGFVSLGVVVSALLVAAGLRVADPLVGLVITVLILRVTVQAWQTVRAHDDHDHHDHDHRDHGHAH